MASTLAREGQDAARSLRSAGGTPPSVDGLLDQVQIDHTVIDVTVVDQRHRLPIGRPYITVAIDVFSRAIVGLVVTLEAPSALSVGLCLTHMAPDKRAWLERIGVEVAWPMSGKPAELYLDNAAEFKSEALRRGCEQHGVKLRWRPLGQPHYGGIVERVIGTMMQMVHELPGTTFSNPQERGRYDSEGLAVLTVGELERWLALAVAGYHGQVHATLGADPGRAVGCGGRGRRCAGDGDERDGVQACSLLASFATSLPLRRPSPIAAPEMASYLLTRSEGTIGELATLLTDAAVAAIESGEEAINQRTLLMARYAGPTERRRLFERELA